MRKVMAGKTIQLSAAQLQSSSHYLHLHPETVRKINRAKKANKGVRITVSPQELDMSGEGIKEILQGMRKAGKYVKENIIDDPKYQKYVKPIVRGVVDTGLAMSSPYLGPVSGYVKKGVNVLGKRTGAYGTRTKKSTRKPAAVRCACGGSFLPAGY